MFMGTLKRLSGWQAHQDFFPLGAAIWGGGGEESSSEQMNK